MSKKKRLAVFIRARLNTWVRWQPVVKFSGFCADVTDGLWLADDDTDDDAWDAFWASRGVNS